MKTTLLLAGLLALAGCAAQDAPMPAPGVPATQPGPLPALAAADAVLYEAFVPAFSAAGTLAGMLPRLDSIRQTGANVLWLMPVHPTHFSPYAVDDYRAINPDFGDFAAFDALVAAAHQRGLRVMLDWVANHTSYHHPWIAAHPDWYNHDAAGNIVHPNPQWLDVADLDFNQPALRRQMTADMKFWVTDHGIDGFRCDAADLVPDDYWQAALAELKTANPNLLLLAEGSNPAHYAAGFQLAFGWDFYTALHQVLSLQWPARTLAATHRAEMQGVPAGCYRLRFTTNHDEAQQGTLPARYGSEAAARAAYVATLAFGAAPLLFNGQETGDLPRFYQARHVPIRWGLDPTAGAFYGPLLRAYNALPALRRGTVEDLSDGDDDLVVRRRLGAAEAAVLLNVRNYPLALALPAALQGPGWTDALSGTAVATPDTVRLPAYGYAIWRR